MLIVFVSKNNEKSEFIVEYPDSTEEKEIDKIFESLRINDKNLLYWDYFHSDDEEEECDLCGVTFLRKELVAGGVCQKCAEEEF